MKRYWKVVFTLGVLLVPWLMTGGSHLRAAEWLPEFELPVPEGEDQRNYLGIGAPSGETFTIESIKTDVLLIELFSMYCPFCQEEAPRVNEVYRLAEEYSQNGKSIKLIGLGASNTKFEVDFFKESFEVPFPLFPDKSLSIYKMLGGEGTPGFVAVRYSPEKKPEIIYRQSGGFDDAADFFSLLLQKAGYQ